jgi:integrase
MPLAMSRPWKHPKTGIYQLRKAVPEDLRKLVGKREEKVSLRTRDPAEAKVRHAKALAELEARWANLRAGPVPLTEREAHRFAMVAYERWLEQYRDNPSQQTNWDTVAGARLFGPPQTREEILAASQRALDGAPELPEDKIFRMEQACLDAANGYLTSNGIIVDDQNRRIMARALGAAIQRASLTLAKLARGEGDDSPEPQAIRFPEFPARAERAKEDSKCGASDDSLSALVEHWWKEAKVAGRKQSTYESYRNTVAKLVGFLKHDQASRVTPQDIVRYKDHRLQGGASAKTVKDSDLAGLKTVFGWAVMNRRMASNPAEGLTIKVGKSRKLRSKGFYDQEASAILKYARSFAAGREAPKLAAAKRWVPWLCAFTGARVGEMLQLRKEDVRREGKHWVVHVTPEAGPVKTDEARDVVLHRQVIEEGFLEFYESSKSGYIFIDPKTGDLGVRKAVKTARNKVNAFVREVVKDPNVDPSHGWRHRFKTVGIEQEVAMRVLDAIQGHAPRNASEDYGDVTITAKAKAIGRFPNINVS